MRYRSIAFQESWPDLRVVDLGARLGFNDVCFQTERGVLQPLTFLRQRADASGYFRHVRSLGMTISLWVHEFSDIDPAWGPIRLENPTIWKGLRDRYDRILGQQLPEVDHLLLTVVETQIKATETALLVRLVETLRDVCTRHGKTLALRTFVHHPDEHEAVTAAIAQIPADVAIMTKCVPQEWHLRSIDDPLIGNVAPHRQIVEVDVAGEYFRIDWVCNAFTDVLTRQFRHWKISACDGLCVRVDRGWKPWEHQATVRGEAQEVNLWLLGRLASDAAGTEDGVWHEYAEHTFGAAAAPAMIEALRPTGEVIAEGLYVEREPFGESKYQYTNPLHALTRRGGDRVAVAYEDAHDHLWRNPFHAPWSVFRWDNDFADRYQAIRRGAPDVIAMKETSLATAEKSALRSLEALDSAQGALPPGAYPFFRFKLEENLFQLKAFGALHLAWLKLSSRLYAMQPDHDARLAQEVAAHIAEFQTLGHRIGEGLTCHWADDRRILRRGQYLDFRDTLDTCTRFWKLQSSL